jgi:uncharacterized protein YjbI with pentapeptide repeats
VGKIPKKAKEFIVKLWSLPAAILLFWCCSQHANAEALRFCLGCNFAGAQLADSNFSGVVYVGSNFTGAVLQRAAFRGAKLVAANFQGADLRGAALDAVECTACNFQGAKLDGATFTGTRMIAANFLGFSAAVDNTALRELLSNCFACNFRTASLAGRDLSGLPIVGVDFSNADLRGTKFDGAALCWYVVDASQRETKCDTMQGTRVNGASFLRVRLCADPSDAGTCVPVTADSLRRFTGSALNGATLP